MNCKFYMPTNVLMGENCVRENAKLFSELGTRALLVTGARSAKLCGAQDDVIAVLSECGIEYQVFDKIMANPVIDVVYEGAEAAKKMKADLIISIGGGSPMDAGKAIALLAAQDIKREDLFSGDYGDEILNMIHIPTTSGTGSEVTQYSVLTNEAAETKMSISSPLLFPKAALLDPRYTMGLGAKSTVNTAIDAFSHAVEGMLSVRANRITDQLACDAISAIASCFGALRLTAAGASGMLSYEEREKLQYASMIAGIVIAHTGTTAVHSMGYSLTFFKGADHGRANGLLLADFLKFTAARLADEKRSDVTDRIFAAAGLSGADELRALLSGLLGEREAVSEEEIQKYTGIAAKAKNVKNSIVMPARDDIEMIYRNSLRS